MTHATKNQFDAQYMQLLSGIIMLHLVANYSKYAISRPFDTARGAPICMQIRPPSRRCASRHRNQQSRMQQCSGEAARTWDVRRVRQVRVRSVALGCCLLSRFAARVIVGVVVLRGPSIERISTRCGGGDGARSVFMARWPTLEGAPPRPDCSCLRHGSLYANSYTHLVLCCTGCQRPLASPRNPPASSLSAVCSKQIRGCRINSSQQPLLAGMILRFAGAPKVSAAETPTPEWLLCLHIYLSTPYNVITHV